MLSLTRQYRTKLFLGLFLLLAVITYFLTFGKSEPPAPITTTVETGTVQQMVSVSGITETDLLSELAFPSGGTVAEVTVAEGAEVEAGATLAILDEQSLQADRTEAAAALTAAIAKRDSLLSGPTGTSRVVTAETVKNKELILTTTQETARQQIDNAYAALLSNNLIAFTTDTKEDATAPIISGTYTCGREGSYQIEVFSSRASSGYSYRLTGLESGTYEATTAQPSPLGTCGLEIKFPSGQTYNHSQWQIDIPNKKSSTYTTYLNSYTLTKKQAEASVALAEQELILARASADNANAPARAEALTEAEAAVTQARARLSRAENDLAKRTLTAPFAGTITKVNIKQGEFIGTDPAVTLLAKETTFKMTARIPEIDISKIAIGQSTVMHFDARSDEAVSGTVSFISPQSVLIDGVSYFEATITFQSAPSWIKDGLNADIDIITAETTGLRVPKRFIVNDAGQTVVLLSKDDTIATSTISVLLSGDDGFSAVSGLQAGDVLMAP